MVTHPPVAGEPSGRVSVICTVPLGSAVMSTCHLEASLPPYTDTRVAEASEERPEYHSSAFVEKLYARARTSASNASVIAKPSEPSQSDASRASFEP